MMDGTTSTVEVQLIPSGCTRPRQNKVNYFRG